jgi:hypothetical protein
MRLAERVGVERLATQHVRVNAGVGANVGAKVGSLIAGMIAGADDIDGMDVLRHGAIPATFSGIRAPSTLGSFLRAFTHANVRQLQSVGRRVLIEVAARTPLLAGSKQLAFIDIDSMQKRVFGSAKQGAAFGHTKIASKSLTVRGLNVLAATICTPIAAPVIATTRLRAGNAASVRGAGSLITEAINTARAAGVSGDIVVRADSAFYSERFITTCARHGAYFSITAKASPKLHRAITAIDDEAWIPIAYPHAVFDEHTGHWISDAQIAETPYTMVSHRTHRPIHGRLIVRRVRDLTPTSATGQPQLFTTYRYHAVFTDSPFALRQAESQHRGHAIIEHIFADLLDGPLAHLPSGVFTANAAWLQLAAIAHTLTRAFGVLASTRHAVARGATIRTELINVAARPARTGRNTITWHLPQHWPWEAAWRNVFHATHPPPARAA